ncbi:hypothetical protein NHJ13051_003516 [Beauveria bassiana]
MNDPQQGDDATHQGFDPALFDDGDLTDSGNESQDSQQSTWREELAKLLLGQRTALEYGKIVKMATWEENGSYTYLHPGLKLRGPSKADLKQYEKWNEWMAKYQAERQARQPATGSDLISRLPVQVLGRILRNLLVFDGRPIHVVSRLDPHYGPDPGLVNGNESIQTDRGAGLRLLNRFHIGNASFSLTCEMPPQVLLAPLSVCKQWNYIGSNLFYSLNNFCFSSLGE